MRAGVALRSISWWSEVRVVLGEEDGAAWWEAAKRLVGRMPTSAKAAPEMRLRRVRAVDAMRGVRASMFLR